MKKLLLLMLILLVPVVHSLSTISGDLALYLEAENNIIDTQGNYTFGDATPSFHESKLGKAFNLSATFGLANTTGFKTACINDSFTIDFFFNTSVSKTGGTSNNLFGFSGEGSNYFNIGINVVTHEIEVNLVEGGSTHYDVQGGGPINDSQWHHVAIMQNDTNMTVWIDGSLTNTTRNFTLGKIHDNLFIGNNSVPAGARNTEVHIDDVAVWCSFKDVSYISDRYNGGNFAGIDQVIVDYNITDLVETSLQTVSVQIDNTSNSTDINSILVYNGTTYSYDTKTIYGVFTMFNYTFNIPFITSNETTFNYSFYFNYNHTTPDGLQSRTSSTRSQKAYKMILTNCTETTTNITTHFIVKDETTDANITSSAISSLFNTWISYNYPNTAYMKNFSISSNNTDYMDVCIYPEWAEYKTDIFLQYSATNYDSRDWIKEAYILNNATKINNLYLLLTSTSSLVTVIVTDENDNYYPNVLIDMESYNIADGSYKLIEIEITNENGEAIFSYDPDTYYRFILYVDGVEKKRTEKAKITSTPLNIQIAVEGAGFIPFSAGITYSFSPSNIVLLNNTNYTFNFNLDSSYWAITNCILYLKNGTTILSQSSSSFNTSNCNISINYNTGNFTSIISQAVYELNTTANETVSVEYNIRYTYVGQFSLKNFLDDLKDFGELGFNDFTRMFIAFIVILGIISTLAFKYSLREPEVLTFLSWALVLLFSYIGWLTLNFNAIPEIKGLATGWLKQYIFFILFSLASGFYIIKKHVE